MALAGVEISNDVLWTCMTHAYTTEAEEIMGLLLGDIRNEGGVRVASIWGALPQIRTDRRKDRVETSPEQMAACSAAAETMSGVASVRTRVIGWYHSHPHITVLPSHVDVRTQVMYQTMEPGFVGLIFSCFNEEGGSKAQSTRCIAFQSVRDGNASGGALETQPSITSQPSQPSQRLDSSDRFDTATRAAIEASLKEAQAHHEVVQEGWRYQEIPLRVLPNLPDHGAVSRHAALCGIDSVLRVLLQEEREAFSAAQHAAYGDEVHAAEHDLLTELHNMAQHQSSLCCLVETVVMPALQAMHDRELQNQLQLQQLQHVQSMRAATPLP